MKKNISINISGIIFNIEEDGYEQLRVYLDEIKRYFATYDDTGEITADIENRVAEIFLTKLSPQKQVITARDVENLIVQMGNVHDFEAIEEPEDTAYAHTQGNYKKSSQSSNTTGSESFTAPPPNDQRFYRDSNRKVIAGIASGIAKRLGIDPLWIRILFVIVLFDLFITFFFSTTLLISYIVVWIVVPERFDFSTENKVKKVFRNPDNRIIGGVAGGLAAYFGIDPVLIRILFFVSIFLGGSGVVAYFVLWLIMPEAKTLTDRMQMQGEPLTLSNIEQNIKKNLIFKENGEEGPVVKAVLLPFRFISHVLSAVARIGGAILLLLADILRIFAGIGLIIVGVAFLLALVIASCFAIGFIPEVYLDIFQLHIPAILAQQTLPPLVLASAFITLFIPGLMVILLGIAVLARRWVLRAAAGWLLFAIWIISLVTLAITAPPFAMNYRTQHFHEAHLPLVSDTTQTIFISLEEVDELDYGDVRLSLQASPKPGMELKTRFYARGKNKADAIAMAKQSKYTVVQKGDTLLLSQHLEIPEDVPFRMQELNTTLYIPVGQKFKMDYSLRKILTHSLHSHGFSHQDLMEDHVFAFNENGQLLCLNCAEGKNSSTTWENEEKQEASSSDEISKELIAAEKKIMISGFPFLIIYNKAIGLPF